MVESTVKENDIFSSIKKDLFNINKINNLNSKETKTLAGEWDCCDFKVKNHSFINISSFINNDSDFANEKWINFYMKTCSCNPGLVFTEGVFDLKHVFTIDKESKIIITNNSLLNNLKELISSMHATGSKIFLTISPNFGRGVKSVDDLYNCSASFNKSYEDANYYCLRISDGKLKDILKKTITLVKFAKEVKFDGVLLDISSFNLFGEMCSNEFNRRVFGYNSGINEYINKVINGIIKEVKNYPIFAKFTPFSFLKSILNNHINEVQTIKKINKAYTESAVKNIINLVRLGVDGFMFNFGTYETEFLTNNPEFVKEGLYLDFYKQIRDVFDRESIKNKFNQKVYLLYHGELERNDLTKTFINNNTVDAVDITRKYFVNSDEFCSKKTQKNFKTCLKCMYCDDYAKKYAKIKCAINPYIAGYRLNKISIKDKKTIAIIGAGISGTYAAMVLAERGFSVDLYEKNNEICQTGRMYSMFDFDARFNEIVYGFKQKVSKYAKNNKINIFLNNKFTAQKESFNIYSAIIIATGYHERFLSVSGAVLKNVKSIYDILKNEKEFDAVNKIVIYAKTELSIKLALYLKTINKNVSLIISSFKIFENLPNAKVTYYAYILNELKIKTYLNAKVKKINEDSVDLIVNNKFNNISLMSAILNLNSHVEETYLPEAKNIDADLFIYEPQIYSNNKLYYDLIKAGYDGELFLIGNALEIGSLADDIHSAFFVANNI